MSAELERARRAEPAWDEVRERRVLARVIAETRDGARRRAPGAHRGGCGRDRGRRGGRARVDRARRRTRPTVARDAPGRDGPSRRRSSGRLALRDGSEVELGDDARVEIEAQGPVRGADRAARGRGALRGQPPARARVRRGRGRRRGRGARDAVRGRRSRRRGPRSRSRKGASRCDGRARSARCRSGSRCGCRSTEPETEAAGRGRDRDEAETVGEAATVNERGTTDGGADPDDRARGRSRSRRCSARPTRRGVPVGSTTPRARSAPRSRTHRDGPAGGDRALHARARGALARARRRGGRGVRACLRARSGSRPRGGRARRVGGVVGGRGAPGAGAPRGAALPRPPSRWRVRRSCASLGRVTPTRHAVLAIVRAPRFLGGSFAGARAELTIAAPACEALDVREIERRALDRDRRTSPRSGARSRRRSCCSAAPRDGCGSRSPDPVTDKSVARTVAMPALDRERVIAIAIAQLFLTSWLELLLDGDEAEGRGPESRRSAWRAGRWRRRGRSRRRRGRPTPWPWPGLRPWPRPSPSPEPEARS